MPAAPAPSRPAPAPLLRRLAHPVLPPAVFDFWAARINPTWSLDRPLARVVGRQVESSDAVTLTLAPNRHWRGFRAGQHLNLGVEVDGVRLTRSYSLVDIPRADGRIAITVKTVQGGAVSRYLCERATIGDVFDIGPAFGEMGLPAGSDAPLLLLAAGSGITPLMSMLRSVAADGMRAPVTLLYWARRRDQLCFVDELRALASAHDCMCVKFVLTGEQARAPDEGNGRLDIGHLNAHVPDLDSSHVFACGPGGFVEVARDLIGERAAAFTAEAFSPPRRPDVADDSGTVDIVLARSQRTLSVARGQSLLGVLEANGLKLQSGCRMGICNTCACGKRAGTTRHLHTGVLEHEPATALKLCVSAADSDLVLDL